MYYVTMQISFLSRKFRNGQRNLHSDVVHITTKSLFCLTLDCNGVFAIKASSAGHKEICLTRVSIRRVALIALALYGTDITRLIADYVLVL